VEPPQKPLRAILPLLKARIVERGPGYFKLAFGPEYGSPTTIRIDCNTTLFDLRDGDILTLYTEVLYAKPSTTSIQ
jgi:hypothetical protein